MGKASMAWVDLETTGLDARVNIPLELGIKLTDNVGFPVAEASWLIWEDSMDWTIEMGKGAAHKIVGPMHEASGLWDDLLEQRRKTTLTREEVDEAVCDFLTDNEVRFGELPMCGNSIGSLDRPFALEHFPKFNVALSYRNIDMSSFKEVLKRVNPGLYENLKPIINNKESAKHRVLDDIDASLIEYRAYIDNFLFTEFL